jgi:biotin carboxylase
MGKVIVHGDNRAEAIARMRRALEELRIEGVRTTADFHRRIMANPDFAEAKLSTNFLEKHRP